MNLHYLVCVHVGRLVKPGTIILKIVSGKAKLSFLLRVGPKFTD